MIDKRIPRFKISGDILNHMCIWDIRQTALDMKELGICNAPFENYCIQLKLSLLEKIAIEFMPKSYKQLWASSKFEIIFVYSIEDGTTFYNAYTSKNGMDFLPFDEYSQSHFEETAKFFDWSSSVLEQVLIVLLATKNIKRDVQICNKPNSRKRREQTLSKYSSTTTISIGKISQTMRSANGTGGPVRPHLRRGHIRNQPYGTGRLEVKRIFIQPMFVNADQGWIDTQKEYRVTA